MKPRQLIILIFSCILLTACGNDADNPTPQDTSPVPTVSVAVSESVTETPTLTPTKKPTKKPTKAPTRTPTPTVTPRPILHGGIKEEIIKNSLEIISSGKKKEWDYENVYATCTLSIDGYTVRVKDYADVDDPKEMWEEYEYHVFFTTLDDCEFWLYVDNWGDGEDRKITFNRVSKEDFLLYVEHHNYSFDDGGGHLDFPCHIWVEDDEIVRIQEIYTQ